MKLTFLGTQAMQPTKARGLSALQINLENEQFLIDCGEGTQRQMRIAEVKPTKLTRVLISHFHADHMLGLAGLLRNLSANDYVGALTIHGPKGLRQYVNHLKKSSLYADRVKLKLKEMQPGLIFDHERFTIEAFKLFHSVDCYGFIIKEKPRRRINLEFTKKLGLIQHPLLGELQRGKDIMWQEKKVTVKKATFLVPGKKYVFIQDTGFNAKLMKYAKDADLLVCESTFMEKEKDKAKEYKHLTSIQAATIAKKAKVKKLILTHFSQRYEDVSEMEKEAKTVFPEVILAEDFMVINV